MSFPGFFYKVDKIPVPVDYFRIQVDLAFQSSLRLLEVMARASAPTVRDYEVPIFGQPNRNFGVNFDAAVREAYIQGHRTVIKNWVYNDAFAAFSLLASQPSTPTPQNASERRLTLFEYLPIRDAMAEALKSEKCRNFIETLVRHSSGHYIDAKEEILGFADYIFDAKDGGIFWSSSQPSQVGRKIKLGRGIRPDLNVKIDAKTLMHELIHGLQGPGADDRLVTILDKLGIVPTNADGTPLPFPTGMRNGKPYNDWSEYWDQALANACFQ